MSLDNDAQLVFRGMVAGNACVAATRWQTVLTVSGPGLRRTPGGPHLPPSPLPLPRWRRGRGGMVTSAPSPNLRTFPLAPRPERVGLRARTLEPLTQWLHGYGI